jgi:predicted DNA-binding protein
MERLYNVRKVTGKPMTVLIKEAVNTQYKESNGEK